jgi:hypothetical protein
MRIDANPPIAELIDSLPQEFDFYHLGRIELSDEPASLLQANAATDALGIASDDRVAVTYALQGEVQGALALLLDGGLDVSTYSEAGNIIASRMATALAANEDREVTISPPRVLSGERLRKWIEGAKPATRTYLHQHEGRTVRLTALVLSASIFPTERTGNA